MPVTFDSIQIGGQYTRPQLAEIWGYKDFHAIGRGAFTPAGSPYVIMFITGNRRGVADPYENSLEDGILRVDGERGHRSDRRFINAESSGDQVHLFYRETDHSPFLYEGQIFLTEYQVLTDRPSRFVFSVGRNMAAAVSAILTEERAHGIGDEEFIPDEEGARRTRQHVVYERSRKNRARALELHGTLCAACGFDFNAFYGKAWAADYIEVHHVESVTQVQGRAIDPQVDLMPVCSNCHSMLHRKRGQIFSISELRAAIDTARLRGATS
jgi:5-methylcytosine-specific restriction enzyme A